MQRKLFGILALFTVLVIQGCATTGATTESQKRQAILKMKQEVLSDLYKSHPEARSKIANAPGYAVFSNANINLVLASFSGGEGVVKNNATGLSLNYSIGLRGKNNLPLGNTCYYVKK